MEEVLRARLLAQVAAPSDWGVSAQGITMPRVVMHRISGGADYTTTGPSGYRESRVQVDCYADNIGKAIILARQVTAALSGWRGGIVLGVFLASERNLPLEAGDAEMLGRVSLDFMVHTQEG